jgi:hypothetical protein
MERQIMKKLPTFIIDKIFTYYYTPQPNELLEDIKNYSKTLKTINKLYYDFWVKNWPFELIPPIHQDKDWLINDLFSYTNQDKATMLGYAEKFYGLWIRFLIEDIWGKMSLLTPDYSHMVNPPTHGTTEYRKYIDSFINCVEKKSSKTQVRIFWGALLPKERDKFVHMKQNQIKAHHHI